MTNWTSFITVIVMMIVGLVAFLKSVQEYVKGEIEKQRLRTDEAIRVAESKVELARVQFEITRHNVLTAQQVADILQDYKSVLDQLSYIKNSTEKKSEEILKLINRVEDMVNEHIKSFNEFLQMAWNKKT